MPIKGHLEPPRQAGEERQYERRNLLLETSGGSLSGEQANVTIHNISASGLLVETTLQLDEGAQITVDLPHEGSVSARVVWQSGEMFGCQFDRTIGQAALSAVELKSKRALPSGAAQFARGPMGAGVVGKRLEQTRKARGLTLAQVADRLGVSKPTVWAWEKGKAKPVEDRLPAIAEVLGVPEDELFSSGENDSVSELLQASREQIAAALQIDPRNVRILIEI